MRDQPNVWYDAQVQIYKTHFTLNQKTESKCERERIWNKVFFRKFSLLNFKLTVAQKILWKWHLKHSLICLWQLQYFNVSVKCQCSSRFHFLFKLTAQPYIVSFHYFTHSPNLKPLLAPFSALLLYLKVKWRVLSSYFTSNTKLILFGDALHVTHNDPNTAALNHLFYVFFLFML